MGGLQVRREPALEGGGGGAVPGAGVKSGFVRAGLFYTRDEAAVLVGADRSSDLAGDLEA
jgi:hypothetical protein